MPSIKSISAVPNFVSKEEHTALVGSTPTSFNDIPPIIKYKEENVSVTLDPPFENITNDNAVQGTLYVLTSVLAFISNAGTGFQIEYPAITLHAVSRGTQPSVYCQLDENYGTESEAASNDEITDMRELTIIPQNPKSLDQIFEALSECAALHPDPKSDEDDLDDAFVDLDSSPFETFNGDENEELSEVGRAALAHLESIIYDPFEVQTEDDNEGSDALEDQPKIVSEQPGQDSADSEKKDA